MVKSGTIQTITQYTTSVYTEQGQSIVNRLEHDTKILSTTKLDTSWIKTHPSIPSIPPLLSSPPPSPPQYQYRAKRLPVIVNKIKNHPTFKIFNQRNSSNYDKTLGVTIFSLFPPDQPTPSSRPNTSPFPGARHTHRPGPWQTTNGGDGGRCGGGGLRQAPDGPRTLSPMRTEEEDAALFIYPSKHFRRTARIHFYAGYSPVKHRNTACKTFA